MTGRKTAPKIDEGVVRETREIQVTPINHIRVTNMQSYINEGGAIRMKEGEKRF